MNLSPREHQVLVLISEGHTNKIIARKLGLSHHTVKRHVVRLFDRINVRSRLQAAIWYKDKLNEQTYKTQLLLNFDL